LKTTTVPVDPLPWHDAKRPLWVLGAAVPVLACLCIAAAVLGANEALKTWAFWVVPALTFVGLPLLDWWIGTDTSNPPDSATRALEADPYYHRMVLVTVPFQLLATAAGAWAAASLVLSWPALMGLVLTVGGVNGFGIVAAHELGHKKTRSAQWLAKIELAMCAYGHFFVEHNRGHHRHVATPVDPASSRLGESFWRFLPRTMVGSLRSAWALERARLAQLGQGPFTLANHNLQSWLMTLVFYGVLTAVLGWPALLFLLVQAFYAASLLEVVNYLEHYGLLRAQEVNDPNQPSAPAGTQAPDPASGQQAGPAKSQTAVRYVRCGPEHSWNSNHTVTNLLLYQLQRHSDHHAHPARQYQALRHFDSSPQLPSGYASMLLLAWIPPLWFAVMDKRVLRHYGGDIHKANLHPPARARLLKRYGAAAPSPAL
jgi:alkane 1-monooxygenase